MFEQNSRISLGTQSLALLYNFITPIRYIVYIVLLVLHKTNFMSRYSTFLTNKSSNIIVFTDFCSHRQFYMNIWHDKTLFNWPFFLIGQTCIQSSVQFHLFTLTLVTLLALPSRWALTGVWSKCVPAGSTVHTR